MMVTRVSLLLLVTGLFAGMWSADSPDSRTVAQKQQARLASSPCAIRHAITPARIDRFKTVSLQYRFTSHSIPLPAGIAPGTYLVVNQAGTTDRLTIAACDSGTPANHVPVDQYTVRTAGARWHFIRLEPPLAQPVISRNALASGFSEEQSAERTLAQPTVPMPFSH